ncbi:hexose transporter protein [Moniliophthora roreri MCA 2997]|uniref:Hexose transporter protein n=2 Tax=Moniliophthora roreri TaxID=221103 RepID=V2XB81_MONRO|nr:hexose transporter protein [Moniliophthora roreri MCA 2997]
MADQGVHDKATPAWTNNTHPKWWKDPGLRRNVGWTIILYLGLFAFGYDSSLITGMIASPRWNEYFGHPTGITLGLIVASLYFPAIVCAPLIAWSLDNLGRKWSIVLGCFGFVAGSLVGCLSTTRAMLIAGRVIIGGTNFLMIAACACLINETMHPRLRAVFSALMMSSLKLGQVVGAWIPFATLSWNSSWTWRLPLLLQAAGPVILLPFAFFLPESPRWLVSKGRGDQALDILARYHANGDCNDELVKYEIKEITETIGKEKEDRETSWKMLFASSGNRRRVAVITLCATGVVWTGSTVVSNYVAPTLKLIGITSAAQITGINGGLAIATAVASTAGSLLVDTIGRRSIWLWSTSAMLILFSVLTGLMSSFAQSPNVSLGYAYIVMLFLYDIAYSFAWIPLTAVYCTEILPYSLRAKGMAYFVTVQSLCTAIALFANPVGIKNIQWRYYIIFIGIIIVHLFLIHKLFIETKGRTIEEVSVMFDGSRAANQQIEKRTSPTVSESEDDSKSAIGSSRSIV